MKRLICIILAALLLLSGCGKGEETLNTPDIVTDVPEAADMFTERDLNTSVEGAVEIKLTEDVILSEEGTYRLSGTLADGQVKIDAPKEAKLHLILEDAHIACSDRAPLYIRQADKVVITLAGDSVNSLQSGQSYKVQDENNVDAALFSKEDLTINGSGTLKVTAPVGHGIVSKDDLVFTGGNIAVSAAAHGVAGKDSIRVKDTSFTIESGKDGLHGENSEDASLGFVYIESGDFNITASGDGVSASGYMDIASGEYAIESGGGSGEAEKGSKEHFFGGPFGGYYEENDEESTVSTKGIKAGGSLRVGGGTFALNCADDALHSNGNLTVEQGKFEISTGDDGLHADETLSIADGTLNVSASYEGLEGKSIHVAGGILSLVAEDDGLNAAGGNDQSGMGGPRGGDTFGSDSACQITISGGETWVYAGGDGVDSNGDILISGGQTVVAGPTSGGNGIMDYGGSASVTGGIFLAYGSADMAQSFTEASQGTAMISAYGNEGSKLTFKHGETTLLAIEAVQGYQCIIFSHPDLVKGDTLTVDINGESASITFEDYLYGATSGGMGGPGGGMGGMGGRPGGGGPGGPMGGGPGGSMGGGLFGGSAEGEMA